MIFGTKYMEVKTIHPSATTNMFASSFPKIDKRIDNPNDGSNNFDVIQPSEVSNVPCTSSCSCSHTKTEGLNTKYTSSDTSTISTGKYNEITSKYGATKLDIRPSNKETQDKKTQYGPYEFDSSSHLAPTDKIVEKYTEVVSDYSDEKDSNSVENSDLLTNEQAPTPSKTTKVSNSKIPDKNLTEKPQKTNKNKFIVADLLKLGTLGIKGLSQLAPVLEKMTGSFIKRQDTVISTTTSTTVKPEEKLTAYSSNKNIDSDLESKHSNFPIYIPVDELETSESQVVFTNATLHQNLAWVAERKNSKGHIAPPKVIHESPLVNGGIPISPGEIITTNSDVIVGKPAVGGPLTLASSGIKLQNPVNPPQIDSFVSANEQYIMEKPLSDQAMVPTKVDDSFDLRPPELPRPKPNRQNSYQRPTAPPKSYQNFNKYPYRMPSSTHEINDHGTNSEHKTTNIAMGNHGRPTFIDYIPTFGIPTGQTPTKHHVDYRPANDGNKEPEAPDNSPSSSEVVNTHIKTDEEYTITSDLDTNKPFLVDIQPSRVANVLIPHGSSTALVFAGSSEPHKTGDYVDDPLPYPEPGYFGSFSIDAPQMTNVHNVAPNNKPLLTKPNTSPSFVPNISPLHKEQTIRNDLQLKWTDNKRPVHFSKIPPPTSNQESHVQIGPKITAYNPDIYNPNNGDFNKYKSKNNEKLNKGKDKIDNEYENYLAVPPPPPKMIFNQEAQYDKNKPYNQRPIIHTKPVQDMKVFLNIQHPIPKEQLPPKVTSEIYFAAQAPTNKPAPTYTIHIPPTSSTYQNTYNKNPINNIQNTNSGHFHNTFSVISSPNMVNRSIVTHEIDKDNTYTVTLNTATNVASSVGDSGHIKGSSASVPIGISSDMDHLKTDIPIKTNFAIRVEDSSVPLEPYNIPNNKNAIIYDEHGSVPIVVSVGDNRWNKSSADKIEDTIIGHHYYNQNIGDSFVNSIPPIAPSINSHANFPMMNENINLSVNTNNVKPIREYKDDYKTQDSKRPGKLIPSIPTNSHGWYSSVSVDENIVKNIDIKTESTTRKIIPLLHEYNEKDSGPDFGQKLSSVGKPPTEFWSQNPPQVVTGFSIGKPFTKAKATEKPSTSISPLTNKPYNKHNYIPSNFGAIQQPAYDIPILDNRDETSTIKNKLHKDKLKPVYENSEEIYDGGEETDNIGELDGEVSSESMKVPVVSSSSEIDHIYKSSTELTLLKDEVLELPSAQNEKNKLLEQSNSGTQTEKPFGSSNKNNTFQSNSITPIYEHMKPRPFTISTHAVLDHQLQQPHWQINQLMENSTNTSEENLPDLNIGEEISSGFTIKPSSTQKTPQGNVEFNYTYKKPPRPFFSSRFNNTHLVNDSGIITSTVHIKDKKPLTVEKATEKTTLPTFTIATDLELNHSSSEIIDLSPPPPTLDFSYKPSTNDELIMGMSPPPPRNPPVIRQPSRTPQTPRPIHAIRTPPPNRNNAIKTVPPRLSTQRPTRKPTNRDEVSTYRPNYDILNNIRRPTFNRDQPSSQLLPPPREIPSRIISPLIDVPATTVSAPVPTNLIFPTAISSGWLTGSKIDFSTSFNFSPTSIQFTEHSKTSRHPDSSAASDSSDNSYSYESEYSSERVDNVSFEKPTTGSPSKLNSTSTEENINDSFADESSEEDATQDADKMKVVSVGNKNRTRKPYPLRNEDKKSTINKYKPTPKPVSIIRPTRTLSRPDILYPSRHTPIRKIVKPIPSRSPTIFPTNIIESSESSFLDDDFIKPTEVLKDVLLPTMSQLEITQQASVIVLTPSLEDSSAVQPTHHAGNEIKISDEIIPTKTEFKTTVVTLTKTLSEPPKTVSSIGYVNLTHTLTVTHTKTSLISQSEGAVTQTLVLTNALTSTIVDVVTEIHTQVQPTTIIETVTKHIPVPQVEPTPVQETPTKTKGPLDDITMSSEESDNFIIKDGETTENIQKIDTESEGDNDTFFVVMNKSQNGGQSSPVNTDIETGDYDGVVRNEQVNSNGVSQVLFGEILLAGAPYLETTNVHHNGVTYGKECQPDCKASRNERCQRIDGIMKCVCRPGFARMFPDRPCKPTYTYSVKLGLGSQGNERLQFHDNLSDNSSKQYHALAMATHEGINRMVMQSDLRDVFHGVHITGFHPVEMKTVAGDAYQGVMNDFYVQLSDNAHESRLKEVIEKYLRNNNYSLGGTDVHADGELVDRLDVSDFDECISGQFHDCSEHAQCFNLRGTYTCSCLEGFADLSVNPLYPGRICSAEPVGCEKCNYHGACYSRDDRRVLCECFQWYAGSTCHINLKVVLIALVVLGALLSVVLAVCAVVACSRRRPRRPKRSIVTCIQSMPSLHQSTIPSKQRADRRALISERGESGDASSVQNVSLPYMPTKRPSTAGKKCVISEPPPHDPPPPPGPSVMIPRARLHPHHGDSRENIARKRSLELSNEAKLISYLESGATTSNDEMRRKHSLESSYSANKDRHNKQGALVSAGFKVSTTIRPDEAMKEESDDLSSVNKGDLDNSHFDSLRKSYSQEDLSEWTDAERRIGELTLSEARSVGGTLPASTGRAASSTRLTHQEANTMAERDLGSTFLLPHVHLYKPDITSDVSEFDSL